MSARRLPNVAGIGPVSVLITDRSRKVSRVRSPNSGRNPTRYPGVVAQVQVGQVGEGRLVRAAANPTTRCLPGAGRPRGPTDRPPPRTRTRAARPSTSCLDGATHFRSHLRRERSTRSLRVRRQGPRPSPRIRSGGPGPDPSRSRGIHLRWANLPRLNIRTLLAALPHSWDYRVEGKLGGVDRPIARRRVPAGIASSRADTTRWVEGVADPTAPHAGHPPPRQLPPPAWSAPRPRTCRSPAGSRIVTSVPLPRTPGTRAPAASPARCGPCRSR